MAEQICEAESIDTAQESFEAVYLNSQHVHFYRIGENLACKIDPDKNYPRVTLRRCFPLSGDRVFLVVRTPETEAERSREIGIINDFHNLDTDSQVAVMNELRNHYFVPVIQKILSIRDEFGFYYWKVITDRGEKEFIMRDNIVHSTRSISKNRWLIIDINNARYEIRDDENLDRFSRKLLAKYLLL